MTTNQIRTYRSDRFRDIIGEANRNTVALAQRMAKTKHPLVGLLQGTYGAGKTTLARLLMKSYLCQRPDPLTADPCQRCDGCIRSGPEYNGEFHNYIHYEVDCTNIQTRGEIIEYVGLIRQQAGGVLFFDEWDQLSPKEQTPILKLSEDWKQGILLVTAYGDSSERTRGIFSPLRDRFRLFPLKLPSQEEMISLLSQKCQDDWDIDTDEAILQELVARSRSSFRRCLDVLDMAGGSTGRKLNREIIEFAIPSTFGGQDLPLPDQY